MSARVHGRGIARFSGRVALVTGASRGIGAAVARRLAEEGAAVVAAYGRHRGPAEALVEALRDGGAHAMAIGADLTDDGQVRALADAALAEFGRIDVLVNNAGDAAFAPALTMSIAALDRMLDVNLKASLRCVQAFAPSMIGRGYGRIVNVASIAALGTALAGTTPYAVAKAAVVQLTKRFALELGPHGVTVNAVCPGATDTDMLHGAAATQGDVEALRAGPGARTMLGRIAAPAEIAAAIAFLASDDASYVTGQALTVDGGHLGLLSRSG